MKSPEASRKEWNVYILRCSDGTLYTGITTDVERRLHEHNQVDSKAARYLKTRRPVELVYQERAPSRGEAMKRERAVKKLSRSRKLKLIQDGI